MARKKQEIALQLEVETQEEWEELLTKEGLIVVDVYQHWAGPSAAFLNVLKECLNIVEHDKMLKLAVAKADTIDSLERYRGKCKPCFLFYAGGSLVAVVRGANAPLLSQAVIEELKKEHRVLKGEAERCEIRDPEFAHLDSEKSALDESESEREDKPNCINFNNYHFDGKYDKPQPNDQMETKLADVIQKEVTVALLKPDIVKEGKADEVLAKMKEAGIEILKHEERQLTEEEAKDFYGHLSEEPFFNELVEFMCSGPSHVLLLSKEDSGKGIIEEWRELIGPKSVEDAKANAPDSLRAQYGTQEMINALHGSDSHQAAARELAFFFPEYQVPTVAPKGQTRKQELSGVQRTLALIRPDVLAEKKDEILARITEAGFNIALQKEIQLTKEQAEGFYSEHKDESYFEELINKMTSGVVLALGLARQDAVNEWRKLLGPKTVSEAKESAPESLRAQYSIDGTEVNMLHGSESYETAEKELEYFFPLQQTVAVIKPDAYDNKDDIIEKIKEAGFHVAARKETTLTREIAEMVYKQNQDQEYYGDLMDHMTSGPTLFMVLTKEDAVEGWRNTIGPTDPAQAKEQAPNSLRASFGTDVKANAVHGASTEESAKEIISHVFGDVKFGPNGKVDKDASVLNDGVEVPEAEQPDEEEEEQAAPEGAETTEGVEGADTATEGAEPKSEEEAAEGEPTDDEGKTSDEAQPAAEDQNQSTTEQAAEPSAGEPADEAVKPADEAVKPADEADAAAEKADTAEASDEPVKEPADEAAAQPADNEGSPGNQPADNEAGKDEELEESQYSEGFSESEEEEEQSAGENRGEEPAAESTEPAAESTEPAAESTEPGNAEQEAEAENKEGTPEAADGEKSADAAEGQQSEEADKQPEGE